MKFFQPPIQVCRVVYIPYFKIDDPIFWYSIFFKECVNPQVKINKMVNEHIVDYQPISAALTSRIFPLIFLWIPMGFISPEYFLNFFSNLRIAPWLRKSFKVTELRFLENAFMSQKINLFIFTYFLKQNSPPASYY